SAYGACFGIEIFIHNVAAMYYVDQFKMDLKTAGLVTTVSLDFIPSAYGACFGIEIFIHNVAAMYYVDQFKMDLKTAG
ncbi:hypothetical protein R5L33_20395, partial [Acinetobacter baumannii]|nr:hypothetical protein [Acinetobacter baumannii]